MTTATDTHGFQSPASPPTKASLTSWWDKFKGRSNQKKEDLPKDTPGIFGVPLQESIKYARVAISMTDANGNSFIYGHIPIVIAKCGVFLKDKATDVEGIFRLSGSAKRIKDLQTTFNTPDKYGKNLEWEGYTVHDAANILRRYLNQLPEPIIPLDFYDKFREPLQIPEGTETNNEEAIRTYQRLISELPPLNRQLLLYILDLLAVFSSKSDINLMPAANLAAIFQPGLISHPDHEMSPGDYRLSQDVLVFLILNQDNFLLGMRGATDDAVAAEGYQSSHPPSRTNSKSKSGLNRHPSNASAGAESVKKFGITRHASTSSRKSIPSPGIGGGGLSRSNTVPSKARSPSANTPTFQSRTPQSPRTPGSPAMTPHSKPPPTENTTSDHLLSENAVLEKTDNARFENSTRGSNEQSSSVRNNAVPHSQSEFTEMSSPIDGLDGDSSLAATQLPVVTPTKERGFASYFSRSPGNEAERRASNKLRKKKIPGSSNPSADSSTTSLNGATISNQLNTGVGQTVPPPSNPASQQPPLLPISASPPNSNDTTPHEERRNLAAPPSPNRIVIPHSRGAQSASTSSLHKAVSQTPSAASSVSSKSSHSNDGKTTDKTSKSRSIWRKSAQKLNLTGTATSASEKISGLMSPPFSRPQNNNSSTHSLGKSRKRSQSVGEKSPDGSKSSSSALPQRGASASGQHGNSPSETTSVTGWIQKKMHERRESKADKDRNALSPKLVPLPITTPIAEVESPLSPKKTSTS